MQTKYPRRHTFPPALASLRRRRNSGDLSLLVTPAANHGSISEDEWFKNAVRSEGITIDFERLASELQVQQSIIPITTNNDPTLPADTDRNPAFDTAREPENRPSAATMESVGQQSLHPEAYLFT